MFNTAQARLRQPSIAKSVVLAGEEAGSSPGSVVSIGLRSADGSNFSMNTIARRLSLAQADEWLRRDHGRNRVTLR